MITISLALFTFLLAFFILSPFFDASLRNQKWNAESGQAADLKLRKQEILTALSDLEYDLQMKKIAPEDYREVKSKLMNEGVVLIQALDEMKRPTQRTTAKTPGISTKKKNHSANFAGQRARA